MLLQKKKQIIDLGETRTFIPSKPKFEAKSIQFENTLSQLSFNIPQAYSISISIQEYTVQNFAEDKNLRSDEKSIIPKYFIGKTSAFDLKSSDNNEIYAVVHEVFRFTNFNENLGYIKCEKIGLLCDVKYVDLKRGIMLDDDAERNVHNLISQISMRSELSKEMLTKLNSSTIPPLKGIICEKIQVGDTVPNLNSTDYDLRNKLKMKDDMIQAKSASIVKFFDHHISIYVELKETQTVDSQDCRQLSWFDYRKKLQSTCDLSMCTVGSMYVPPTSDTEVNNHPVLIANAFARGGAGGEPMQTSENKETNGKVELKSRMIMSDHLEFYNPVVELLQQHKQQDLNNMNDMYTRFCKLIYENKKQPWKIEFNSFLRTPQLNFDFPCSFLSRDNIINNSRLSLRYNPVQSKIKIGDTIEKLEESKDLEQFITKFELQKTSAFGSIGNNINQTENDIKVHYILANFTYSIFVLIMKQLFENMSKKQKTQHIVTPQFCNIITGSVFDYNYPIRIATRSNIKGIQFFDFKMLPTINIPIYTPFENLKNKKKIEVTNEKIKSTIIVYNINSFKKESVEENKDYIVISNSTKQSMIQIKHGVMLDFVNYLKSDVKTFILKENEMTENDNEDLIEDETQYNDMNSKQNKGNNTHNRLVTNGDDIHIILGSPNSKLMIAALSHDTLDESNVFQYQVFLECLTHKQKNDTNDTNNTNMSIDTDHILHNQTASTAEFTVQNFWKNAIWELESDNKQKADVYFTMIPRGTSGYLWLPLRKVYNLFFLDAKLLREWGFLYDKDDDEKENNTTFVNYTDFSKNEDGIIKKLPTNKGGSYTGIENRDFQINLFMKQLHKGMPVKVGKQKEVYYLKSYEDNVITLHSTTNGTLISKNLQELSNDIENGNIRLKIGPILKPHKVKHYFFTSNLYFEENNPPIFNNIYEDIQIEKEGWEKMKGNEDNSKDNEHIEYVAGMIKSISKNERKNNQQSTTSKQWISKTNFKTIFNKIINDIESHGEVKQKERIKYMKKIEMLYKVCLRNINETPTDSNFNYNPLVLPGGSSISVKTEPNKNKIENIINKFKSENREVILKEKNHDNNTLILSIQSKFDFTRTFASFASNFSSHDNDYSIQIGQNWNKKIEINNEDEKKEDFVLVKNVSYRYRCEKVLESIDDVYEKIKYQDDQKFSISSIPISDIVPTKESKTHSNFSAYGDIYSMLDERQKFEWLNIIYTLIKRSIEEYRKLEKIWFAPQQNTIEKSSQENTRLVKMTQVQFEDMSDRTEFMHSSFIDERFYLIISEFETATFEEEFVKKTIDDIQKELIQLIGSKNYVISKKSDRIYTLVVSYQLPLLNNGINLATKVTELKIKEDKRAEDNHTANENVGTEGESMETDESNIDTMQQLTDNQFKAEDNQTANENVGTKGESMETDESNIDTIQQLTDNQFKEENQTEDNQTTNENVGTNGESMETDESDIDTIQQLADDLSNNPKKIAEACHDLINDMLRNKMSSNITDQKTKTIETEARELLTTAFGVNLQSTTIPMDINTMIHTLLDRELLRGLRKLSKRDNKTISLKKTLSVKQQEIWTNYVNSTFSTYFINPEGLKINRELEKFNYIMKDAVYIFENIELFCKKENINKNFKLIAKMNELKQLEGIQIETIIKNTAMSIPNVNVIINTVPYFLRIITAQTCIGWDIIVVYIGETRQKTIQLNDLKDTVDSDEEDEDFVLDSDDQEQTEELIEEYDSGYSSSSDSGSGSGPGSRSGSESDDEDDNSNEPQQQNRRENDMDYGDIDDGNESSGSGSSSSYSGSSSSDSVTDNEDSDDES